MGHDDFFFFWNCGFHVDVDFAVAQTMAARPLAVSTERALQQCQMYCNLIAHAG